MSEKKSELVAQDKAESKILNLVFRLTSVGREHRRSAGTVSDLKVGTLMEVINELREISKATYERSTKVEDQEVSIEWVKLSRSCLQAVTTAAGMLPDIDTAPPGPAPSAVKEEKGGPPKGKGFRRSAEPVDQAEVQINIGSHEQQRTIDITPIKSPALPPQRRTPTAGKRQDPAVDDDW